MSNVSNLSNPYATLYTGIFADEKILQLLLILQFLSENCFSKLHEVANEGNPSTVEYLRRFRLGLDSIDRWRPEVKTDEANFARKEYPEITSLYQYAIVRYLKKLHENDTARQIPVSLPPLPEFIFAYYLALAKSHYMQRMNFSNVIGIDRAHMHMEALRTTLMKFTRHAMLRGNSSIMSGTMTPTTQALPASVVRVEPDVTPWDSVSQVGKDKHHHHSQHHHQHHHHRSHKHSSSPSHNLTNAQDASQRLNHSERMSRRHTSPRTRADVDLRDLHSARHSQSTRLPHPSEQSIDPEIQRPTPSKTGALVLPHEPNSRFDQATEDAMNNDDHHNNNMSLRDERKHNRKLPHVELVRDPNDEDQQSRATINLQVQPRHVSPLPTFQKPDIRLPHRSRSPTKSSGSDSDVSSK